MTPSPDLYDVVQYPAFAFPDTHPSRLATMALLHGLEPAAVQQCRVLEIGCNEAANLIPMAHAIPRSEFVGFDLAADPIARGQARIQALGLTNIRILQVDLLEAEQVPELSGTFDYIIAHGVYAWVPPAVRERLLGFCRDHLAPNGVVFVSYAALPGGHIRMLARQILLLREHQPEEASTGVRESTDFLKFIARCRPEGDGFRVLLEREVENMERRGPEVVFHDELAAAYQPVSFTQFANHAAEHGLRYFTEAEFPAPKDPCFQADTAAAIQQLAGGDPLAQEQMLDFARMRMYRQSLLCPQAAVFTYDLQADALRRLFMTSQAESTEGSSAGSRSYTLPGGLRIETVHPATIAVLDFLIARNPESVSFADVSAVLEQQGLLVPAELLMLIMRLVIARMIDLDAWQAPVTRTVPDRPLASAVCRNDSLGGIHLTTLLHTTLKLDDPIARQLLLLLDGTRDRDALLRDLTSALPEVAPQALAEGIGPALELLSRTGVLEAPRA